MTSQPDIPPPGSSRPRQLFAMLRRQLFGLGKPRSSESWDESFAKGEWAHLDGQPETPRFAALVRLIVKHDPGTGGILDVGCGAGTLCRHLPHERRLRYLGSDISAEALAQARRSCPESTVFLHEPADAFASSKAGSHGPFGIIVLSEVLYYVDDPIATVRHYRRLLRPDGAMIISLWSPRRHVAMRWRLRRALEVLATEIVASPDGAGWELTVAK